MTEADELRDQSRVLSVPTGNGSGRPVVVGGRLDCPPGCPHGGRRVLLPALAVTGGGRLIRALVSGRWRSRPRRQPRRRAAPAGPGYPAGRHRRRRRGVPVRCHRTRAEPRPRQRREHQVDHRRRPDHEPLTPRRLNVRPRHAGNRHSQVGATYPAARPGSRRNAVTARARPPAAVSEPTPSPPRSAGAAHPGRLGRLGGRSRCRAGRRRPTPTQPCPLAATHLLSRSNPPCFNPPSRLPAGSH